eukprot:TRINITY_DN14541_c0_g1_i1.p1 TRINITY_DN14541_c0_g1~~TRINITY_DN14541_c0_g1_i1.p1  ORF type:complete len:365 (-),score=92.61 TRINITY_DN14541_c0_g1_i1:67-1161(-)
MNNIDLNEEIDFSSLAPSKEEIKEKQRKQKQEKINASKRWVSKKSFDRNLSGKIIWNKNNIIKAMFADEKTPKKFENLMNNTLALLSSTRYNCLYRLGLKLKTEKNLSPHFEASHTININNADDTLIHPPGFRKWYDYNFETVFSKKKLFLRGTLDNEGEVMGKAVVIPSEKFQIDVAQISSNPNRNFVTEFNITDKDYHVNLQLVDGIKSTTLSYTQRINPPLTLGVSLQHMFSKSVLNKFTVLGLGFEYNTFNSCITGNMSVQNLIVSKLSFGYLRRLTNTLNIATDYELEYDQDTSSYQSKVQVGYLLKTLTHEIKGVVDGKGCLYTLFTESWMPFNISFSSVVDFIQKKCRFGVEVNLNM